MSKPMNSSFLLKTNDQLIAIFLLTLIRINVLRKANIFVARSMSLANKVVLNSFYA